MFRIVEFATGWNGPVYTHEQYFYIFDASVLYILSCCCTNFSVPATAVFVFVFPARYGVLGNKQLEREVEARKLEFAGREYEMQA